MRRWEDVKAERLEGEEDGRPGGCGAGAPAYSSPVKSTSFHIFDIFNEAGIADS